MKTKETEENEDISSVEMRNILQGLAKEIIDMSEEEKLLSLKKIVKSELSGNKNRFWTTITKKMLVNEELASKIALGDQQLV